LQKQGISVRFGVVFGSWAKGLAHRWSDIDLVVVSPQFDRSPSWTSVTTLWRQAARIDSRIEPVACGEKQWQEDNVSGILDVARREGERVSIEEEPVPRA
jgi:hypothetical protein